ncbi:MAG: cytochrome [Sphingobacteriaceae bacterium]|jgi:cytochrome c oxidase cbb3-type subunit 3|nr:cytochrome [Sphingobacteriaceae bacterium]
MKKLVYTFLLLLPASTLMAQQAAAPAEPVTSSGDLSTNLFVAVCIFGAIIVLVGCLALLRAVQVMAEELMNPKPYVKPVQQSAMEYADWAAHQRELKQQKPSIWTKILSLRPLSEEKDIMLEHEFDGIAELDNPTPAWFMWLFYGTIVFGAGYLMYYHVLGYGKMQEQEYVAEMQVAAKERAAFLATSANNIDESSVKESKDPGVIASGKAIYAENCVACHADKGQGLVGPNLTDEFWLHGGKVGDIFKTIKYGVPEKGMISWEKKLTPKQISDATNFVLSLQGTNPPNPKAPQGQKGG